MAAKTYHVDNPEHLRDIEEYAIEKPSGITRHISIWTTARKKKPVTRWDKAFYISFSGCKIREAFLFRIDAFGNIVRICELRYNLALHYCQDHLQQVNN